MKVDLNLGAHQEKKVMQICIGDSDATFEILPSEATDEGECSSADDDLIPQERIEQDFKVMSSHQD